MRYCPDCGQQVAETDAYCFECGGQLQRTASEGSRVESMGTVWAGGLLGVLGLFESAILIFAQDMVMETAQDFGVEDELSSGMLSVLGGFGMLLSLCVIGLAVYYHSQGYVDKRYFLGLLAVGLIGLLFAGGGLSQLLMIVVAVYGLGWLLRK